MRAYPSKLILYVLSPAQCVVCGRRLLCVQLVCHCCVCGSGFKETCISCCLAKQFGINIFSYPLQKVWRNEKQASLKNLGCGVEVHGRRGNGAIHDIYASDIVMLLSSLSLPSKQYRFLLQVFELFLLSSHYSASTLSGFLFIFL